jgi:hypothetical protein
VLDELKGAAIVGPIAVPRGTGNGQQNSGGANGGRAAADRASDFTTTRRLDVPRAPAIQAGDAFYLFLFSKARMQYDELKRLAEAQEPLPGFRLDGVTITFNIDNDYDVVRTQLTQNVVGIVEGSDPQLKSTYVAFGAHYDHVGYSEAPLSPDGTRPPPPSGLAGGPSDDIIWNGADDDGSGTVALMALAEAYSRAPRPKRSLLFIWHAGEELGTYGSLYFVEHPTVPLATIVAQLNIDMIGRNRNDDAREGNTVYLVGSDRISSDQVSRDANQSLASPLTISYDMNDASDPEQIYYRSDHYSYASHGIPVIFFTTGLHPDYHTNTDDVSRILFDKLMRVAGLVYETGERLANLNHAPVRDDKGPRAVNVKGTP